MPGAAARPAAGDTLALLGEAGSAPLLLAGLRPLKRSRAAATGGPLCVGVFVNASLEEMNATAERVGLDLRRVDVR